MQQRWCLSVAKTRDRVRARMEVGEDGVATIPTLSAFHFFIIIIAPSFVTRINIFFFLFVILIFHAWLVEMLLCNFLESWRWLQNDLDFFDDSEHQVGFWPNTSDLFPILRKTSSSYPSRLKSTLLIAINSLVKLSLLCKTFSFLVRFLNCHECLPEASGLGNLANLN